MAYDNRPRRCFFLTFFLRGGFVNRNGMVVSLHRERVETHFDEVTDFLDFSVILLNTAGQRIFSALPPLCFHSAFALPSLPGTAVGTRRTDDRKKQGTQPRHGDDTKNGTKDSGRRMIKLWLF